jgi:Rrf2 family transcriptional regulator, iron-sulfur cluster assembly transcription factor
MRVTKWGECGLLCAVYLAHRYGPEAIGATEIAESQGFDLQYTQQVLHRLKKGDIIETVRGPKGGYRLKRAAEEINLYQILLAAEGDTFEIICEHSPIHPSSSPPHQCADKLSCGLHHVWMELRDTINTLLQSKTLAALAAATPAGMAAELVEISAGKALPSGL